jgi:hypothetical protein
MSFSSPTTSEFLQHSGFKRVGQRRGRLGAAAAAVELFGRPKNGYVIRIKNKVDFT